MTLLATDLEVSCAAAVRPRSTEGGSLTLPAKKLYEVVKALPETDVRIEQEGATASSRRRSVRFSHADAAARGFSDAARIASAGGASLPRESASRRWSPRRSLRLPARTRATT